MNITPQDQRSFKVSGSNFRIRRPYTLTIQLILIILSLFIISLSNTLAQTHDTETDPEFDIDPNQSTNPARLEVSKSVERKTIFVNGSGKTPGQTRVTLTVRGLGLPGIDYNPQDVVFIMDNSDSMDENDNEYKRIEALKLYLEKMIPPGDRAALVKFSKDAEVVNDHHLTSDYSQLIADLPALWHTTGLTNLGAAIKVANHELIEYGDSTNNSLVQILLTDGRPEPPENNVTMDTINEAIDHNIRIYTVGLGKDHDTQLLRWISKKTGGKYYYAKEAADLLEIYDELSSQFRNYTAGMDLDTKDLEPLLRDVLPAWVDYVEGSFSKEPDFIGQLANGGTKLEWNISKISIGEVWSVSYNITSGRAGEFVPITDVDLARVKYYSQLEKIQVVKFPEYYIRVLPKYDYQYPAPLPPPPPPPPPPLPPPPPPSGFPIPAPPATTPVPISLTPPVPMTAGATPAAVPVEYLFAGFMGLALAERIKQRRLLRTRQKVAMGI
jgi:hypothetical protein